MKSIIKLRKMILMTRILGALFFDIKYMAKEKFSGNSNNRYFKILQKMREIISYFDVFLPESLNYIEANIKIDLEIFNVLMLELFNEMTMAKNSFKYFHINEFKGEFKEGSKDLDTQFKFKVIGNLAKDMLKFKKSIWTL